jgi:methylated-DNA-[protein]-cysteine S-methyltransferase
MPAATLPTPIGTLWVRATEHGLAEARFVETGTGGTPTNPVDAAAQHPVLALACQQLAAYFAGQLKEFTLPLATEGTPFQQRVWQAVRAVPYGRTASYTELTARLGDAKAIRAVAAANARNPLAVVVPCHRVLGSDGSLTGYAWGLHRKEWLLRHEGALAQLPLV